MATKTIAWTTGSGNITLTYTGQGNGSISVASTENDLFEDRSQNFSIVTTDGSPEQALSILVKQKGKSYASGTEFNFEYTGSVQQVTLPKGKYKLQCWGAQGGTSYGSSSGAGSKGGYSEGVITLTETTTFYVFVGGQGSRGSSTSLVNGGWNGGGAAVGKSYYNSGNTNGRSNPACGGGATDISTVTSSMSYSSGRTNRSSASLLARCIVAGGGAGGSYRYTSETVTDTSEETVIAAYNYTERTSGSTLYVNNAVDISEYAGSYATFSAECGNGATSVAIYLRDSSWAYVQGSSKNGTSMSWSGTIDSSVVWVEYQALNSSGDGVYPSDVYWYMGVETTTTSTETSSGYSNKSQQGGGTSGKGQYPGTQTKGGNGNGNDGGFGYGGNQSTTNYRYCSGGGGGGWYGGGTAHSDSSTSYINYSGGGSGFVNTAANASSRPSGYTGLQLDSGTTTAGSSSFESVSGGTETGHSGNGYARITVL